MRIFLAYGSLVQLGLRDQHDHGFVALLSLWVLGTNSLTEDETKSHSLIHSLYKSKSKGFDGRRLFDTNVFYRLF